MWLLFFLSVSKPSRHQFHNIISFSFCVLCNITPAEGTGGGNSKDNEYAPWPYYSFSGMYFWIHLHSRHF